MKLTRYDYETGLWKVNATVYTITYAHINHPDRRKFVAFTTLEDAVKWAKAHRNKAIPIDGSPEIVNILNKKKWER